MIASPTNSVVWSVTMSSEAPRTATEKWKWIRREVIIRDEYTCQRCGAEGAKEGSAQLEVHHITPVSEGGSNHKENLETLCSDCHNSHHAKASEETYLDAVRENEPATTQQVADTVGVTRQGADYRLRELREEGLVEGEMLGNTLIWTVIDEATE